MTAPSLLDKLEVVVRLSEAATPGPWQWIQRNGGHFEVAATHGGGTTVMDFARQGMNGAQPRFGVSLDGEPRGKRGGILRTMSELIVDNDGVFAHPDAELFVAAVNFIRTNHAEIADLTKLKARIAEAPIGMCNSQCLNSAPDFDVRTNRSDWRGKRVRLLVEDEE